MEQFKDLVMSDEVRNALYNWFEDARDSFFDSFNMMKDIGDEVAMTKDQRYDFYISLYNLTSVWNFPKEDMEWVAKELELEGVLEALNETDEEDSCDCDCDNCTCENDE